MVYFVLMIIIGLLIFLFLWISWPQLVNRLHEQDMILNFVSVQPKLHLKLCKVQYRTLGPH